MSAVIKSDTWLFVRVNYAIWLVLSTTYTFWQIIIHCSLQTKTNKKCMLWQRNRMMPL